MHALAHLGSGVGVARDVPAMIVGEGAAAGMLRASGRTGRSRGPGGRAGRSAAASAGAAGDGGSLSDRGSSVGRGRRRRGLLVEGVEDGVEPGHDGRRGLGALDGTRGGREELQGFGVGADDVNEQVGGPAIGPWGAVAMVL